MNGLELLALLQPKAAMPPSDRPSAGDWADVLATFPLFAGASKRNLRKLVRKATFAELAPGDSILANGQNDDSLYVILGGAARSLGKAAPGTLHAGDYFGELAVIDGAPRPATVFATQELQLMRVPRQSVVRLAEQHPGVAVTMLRNLIAQLRAVETDVARSRRVAPTS
jgi:CRP-like cAMP-binding protein